MLFASGLGQIAHPFYAAFAWLMATFYSVIPNYAIAIALLTLTVMIVVFPITLKGTRGMLKMQLLAPEMKIIQARYKAKAGMTVEERQEARQKLNEEMMALYKENNANPAGGCIPMFLQFPFFIILYGTIRGLTHTSKGVTDPLYLSKTSRLYKDVIHAHGQLNAFGINLAHSVKSPGSWSQKVPFIALILIAIGLQYLQMKQMSGRNPAQQNPQMQSMQKIFPLIFAVVYISIPAGVNIYFIVSSLFRVCQQGAMYRWDPHLQTSMAQLRTRTASTVQTTLVTPRGPKPPGILTRLRQGELGTGSPRVATNGASTNGSSTNGATANGLSDAKGPKVTPPRVQAQTRSRDKKPRRRR